MATYFQDIDRCRECPPLRADGHSSLQNQGGIKVQPCDQLTLILRIQENATLLPLSVLSGSVFIWIPYFINIWSHRMARASLRGCFQFLRLEHLLPKQWRWLPLAGSAPWLLNARKNAAWLDKCCLWRHDVIRGQYCMVSFHKSQSIKLQILRRKRLWCSCPQLYSLVLSLRISNHLEQTSWCQGNLDTIRSNQVLHVQCRADMQYRIVHSQNNSAKWATQMDQIISNNYLLPFPARGDNHQRRVHLQRCHGEQVRPR